MFNNGNNNVNIFGNGNNAAGRDNLVGTGHTAGSGHSIGSGTTSPLPCPIEVFNYTAENLTLQGAPPANMSPFMGQQIPAETPLGVWIGNMPQAATATLRYQSPGSPSALTVVMGLTSQTAPPGGICEGADDSSVCAASAGYWCQVSDGSISIGAGDPPPTRRASAKTKR
ncbi:hypothetical protein [Streptomyces sp. NPDC086023]|uniref:hypothetical protein n=1 Tax=Streptomyces sp. NPDC086023 TaxID=3365746 RepID=UPI0037CD0F71